MLRIWSRAIGAVYLHRAQILPALCMGDDSFVCGLLLLHALWVEP